MAPTAGSHMKKRQGAALSEKIAEKRPRTTKRSVEAKCALVGAALTEAQEYPNIVRSMLAGLLPDTLAVPSGERHEFQDTIVSMMEKALQSREQQLENHLRSQNDRVTQAEQEQTQLETAATSAEANLAAKRDLISEKKTQLESEKAAYSNAQKALLEAEKAKLNADRDIEEVASNKQKLNDVLADCYEPLKNGLAEKVIARKHTATILTVGKKFKFESSLLSALPDALSKTASDRSSFDGVIFKQFEDAVSQHIAAFDAKLAEAPNVQSEKEAVVKSAQEECNAALERKTALQQAIADASTEQRDCEKALKVAKDSLRKFALEVIKMVETRDTAKSELSTFQEGALAAFIALKDPALPMVDGSVEKVATVAHKADVSEEVAHKADVSDEMPQDETAEREPEVSPIEA